MKRLWIGIVILATLLSLGIGTSVFAIRTHERISRSLEQASEAALRGNWEKAKTLSLEAKEPTIPSWHPSKRPMTCTVPMSI